MNANSITTSEPQVKGAVAVLVRSMARVSLGRTLDSITTQNYPDIRIHVVAACGDSHPELPSTWNGRPLTLHRSEIPLQRAAAANRLLDAVDAEYFAFIDDDDEWSRDHLSALVGQLNRFPSAGVAFSQAALLDDAGKQFGLIGHPFHAIELSQHSPMAFHAALYRAEPVLATKARLDESLERLEDTDFVLALCVAGIRFAFLPRASAIWNAMAGTSGHGFSDNADRAEATRHQERVQQKWKPFFERWLQEPRAQLALARAHLRLGRQRPAEMLLYRLAKHRWTNPSDHQEFLAVCQLAGVVDQGNGNPNPDQSAVRDGQPHVLTVPAQAASNGQNA